jgi:hypothetical protein
MKPNTQKLAVKRITRHDVLTCPSSTLVGYRWGRKSINGRATLRRAGHEKV